MQNIPNFFWYALSLCMVAVTTVLLVIAWKASSVSIEVDSYKLKLKSVVVDTKTAQQQLELKRKRLADAELLLNERIDELSHLADQFKASECNSELPKLKQDIFEPSSSNVFRNLLNSEDFQLDSLQDAIRGLENLDSGLAGPKR